MIADHAGGEWPDRIRAAVEALGHVDVDEETLGVRLLADIRVVFTQKDADRIPTGDLIKGLCEIEESPWGDWSGSGKPITSRKFAALLKPFLIRSAQFRDGAEKHRGYLREAFQDAWERYLRPDPDVQSGTSGTTRTVEPKTAVPDPGQNLHLPRIENSGFPHNQADVPDVPDWHRDSGTEAADEALTLDQLLTGNGASDWLIAHGLEDVTPPAIPYEKLSKAEQAELARLHAKHRDLADGGEGG